VAGVGKARLVETRKLTYDTNEYTFELLEQAQFKFRAGQFVSIRCGTDPDGTLQMRSYSIASPSSQHDRFSLVVKIIPGGFGSQFFTALAQSSEIEFTGPMGFFVLDLQHAGDIVIGATGTGLAPVIPMLGELAERKETGKIRLYFGVRKLEDLFYEDMLDEFARKMPRFSWLRCITQAPPDWTGGERCRITGFLTRTVEEMQKPVFYLVGNGAMIKEAKQLLQEKGVDRKKQIRTEAFFD
jgi:ferredoxin-NADP reductase